MLGLVGPPGGGKSTLAQALLAALPGRAVVIPMDGFHLANTELARLGRAERKGAPDTFDIEEPIAGAIAVEPRVPLVITEGNYLLLKVGHWARVRELLDEVWFVNTDDALRRARLVQRHVDFGRTPPAARDWVDGTDELNARLVAASQHLADVQFRWDGD